MRFPNKVISYKNSILPKLPLLLDKLTKRDYDVITLYHELNKKMSASDFINGLDCLFALGKITLDKGVLHYVS